MLAPAAGAPHAAPTLHGHALARVARAFLVLFVVELVWSLAYTVYFRFLASDAGSSDYETVLALSTGAGLVFGIADVVLLSRLGAAVRGSTATRLVGVAVASAAVALVLDLVLGAALLGGSATFLPKAVDTALVLTSLGAGLLARSCFWLAVTRLLQGRAPAWVGVAYLALLGAVLLLSLPPIVLPSEVYFETFRSTGLVSTLSNVRFLASLTARFAVIWAVVQLGRHATAMLVGGEGTVTVAADVARSPTRDMAIGAAWLVGGIAVSVVSHTLASEGGGGRYVIATGAIAYGLARVFRGMRAGV